MKLQNEQFDHKSKVNFNFQLRDKGELRLQNPMWRRATQQLTWVCLCYGIRTVPLAKEGESGLSSSFVSLFFCSLRKSFFWYVQLKVFELFFLSNFFFKSTFIRRWHKRLPFPRVNINKGDVTTHRQGKKGITIFPSRPLCPILLFNLFGK